MTKEKEYLRKEYPGTKISEYGSIFIIAKENGTFRVVACRIVDDRIYEAATGEYNQDDHIYACAIDMVEKELNEQLRKEE